jgi:arylsulfatase A-like enzyme
MTKSRHYPRLTAIKIFLFVVLLQAYPSMADSLPNIIIILTDDQGYADLSVSEYSENYVNTPNIDKLVRSGVFFSDAYTSGNVCSPTRAGLMTGRYQQRMGIYTAQEGGKGVPLNEKMIPQYLKQLGYVSGAFGKWHMGISSIYNPINRGFDEFYGFLGKGGHDYFCLHKSCYGEKFLHPMFRNLSTINDKGYLTDRIGEEAVSFITNHKDKPFFAYIAFNALHAPAQAPKKDIAVFKTGDKKRDILMGMLNRLDIAIGNIVGTIDALNLRENTLIFFLTDNGGSRKMRADNAPLRGFKQSNYEGGIRVPFSISWPKRVPIETVVASPVISLDVLTTILSALNIEQERTWNLDGRDLLAVIDNRAQHDFLAWNSGNGSWAIRQDKWKLGYVENNLVLFDVLADKQENASLLEENVDIADKMYKTYINWLSEMKAPTLKSTIVKPACSESRKSCEKVFEALKNHSLTNQTGAN